MKLYIQLTILLFLCITPANATIKLPAIVSSNMVLQRNSEVNVWGWAGANEKITIKTSWFKNAIKITANDKGNWTIKIKTTNSKKPQTITLTSKDSKINLKNILFGEVWLCSGQSNMYHPMKGYPGQPTYHAPLAIAKANNFNLRLFSVHKIGSKKPLKDLKKHNPWQQATPSNVADFSAIGYFYGQQLQQILDCPVGIIHTSWGGSTIQSWMSKETVSNYENIHRKETHTQRTPTALFNAMIHPLIPYTIKGMLWYQGESNRNNPELYKKLFPAMVKDWRARWGIGDFFFNYVQIAPFNYKNLKAFNNPKNTAFLREAQLHCLKLIPNSAMAVTLDIGHKDYIHPPEKKKVADRLLFNALNQTYGFSAVNSKSPSYKSLEIKDKGILLSFNNKEQNLYTYKQLADFEIAGDDKVFYPATAKIINRKKVFVSSSKVPKPVAVRYAWSNWVSGSLFGGNLLPVSSFRTDHWKDATRSNK